VILSFAHVKSGKLKLAAVKSCLLDIEQRRGGRDETDANLGSAFKANAFKPNSGNNFRSNFNNKNRAPNRNSQGRPAQGQVYQNFDYKASQKVKCFRCQQFVHKKNQCPRFANVMQTQSNEPTTEPEGFVFITALISENKDCLSTSMFLDLGASEHLINDVNLFLNVKNLEKPVS